jgi:hypothetical protein
VAVKTSPLKVDCTPSFNMFYRLLFMVIFLIVNTALILPVHQHLFTQLPGYSLSLTQLMGLHGIMVALNCILALFLPKQTAFDYLGQVNMLTLVTNLLLIPLVLIDSFIQPGNWVNYGYLVLVSIVVFQEYFRRMSFANMLDRYWLVLPINLALVMGMCICLFIPFNK